MRAEQIRDARWRKAYLERVRGVAARLEAIDAQCRSDAEALERHGLPTEPVLVAVEDEWEDACELPDPAEVDAELEAEDRLREEMEREAESEEAASR